MSNSNYLFSRPSSSSFEDNLKKVFPLFKEPYHFLAYCFVKDLLKMSFKRANKPELGNHHLSVEQIVEDFQNFSLESFGDLTKLTLEHLGINSVYDLGKIISTLEQYNMIKLSSKDNLDDFQKFDFDFEEYFDDLENNSKERLVLDFPKIDTM